MVAYWGQRTVNALCRTVSLVGDTARGYSALC